MKHEEVGVTRGAPCWASREIRDGARSKESHDDTTLPHLESTPHGSPTMLAGGIDVPIAAVYVSYEAQVLGIWSVWPQEVQSDQN
jgi:hypothetical protein